MNVVINKIRNKAVTWIRTIYMYETNSLEIGNKFIHFTTIVQKLVEKVDTRLNFQKFMDRSNNKKFFMLTTNKNKIEKIIKSLYSKKPSNIYRLPIDMLKIVPN